MFIYSILIYAQILQIWGLDLLMNDDYNPLEARLLKYSNTPEIISQSNTIPITCINLL